jgi:hypothetical protein
VDKFLVEYSTDLFVDEVQAVRVACSVVPEIQTISTSTADQDEVQLVHLVMDEAYVPHTRVDHVQGVWCSGTGGTFSMTLAGRTTQDLPFDASCEDVEGSLLELEVLHDVRVVFGGDSSSHACTAGPSTTAPQFNITFKSVDEIAVTSKDLARLRVNTNNLDGDRRARSRMLVKGLRPLGGSFRLSFRGDRTRLISATADSEEVQAALQDLDTIQHSGVRVTNGSMASIPRGSSSDFRSKETMWAVTFIGSGVGGDVESLYVSPGDNLLTGSGASGEPMK